jgi:hypothetical protein
LKATDCFCTLWRNYGKKRAKIGSFKRHGCIIGFTKDVDYDIEFIAESKLYFGGEGFYATLRGPNRYIQSLPFSRLADRIIASAPRAGGDSRGEGSILAV